MTATLDRRLYVFFEAGGARYVLQAVSVVEVAHPDENGETLHGHLGLRDLSLVLGGDEELRPGTALVLDTSPTRAVRVASVEGVFDLTGLAAPALPRRLIPLVNPAVRGAVVRDEKLYFELETDAVARGLPRQTKRPELSTFTSKEPCLVFQSSGVRFGVPLSRVRQVVNRGPNFNRAPSRGAFLGAAVHRELLFPVFSVGNVNDAEAFMVLVDVRGEVLGLSADHTEGVKGADQLGEVQVLDLERMFS